MTTHSNGKHTRSSSSPTHNHHKYYIKISSTWTEFIDPKITGFHFYIKSFPSRHQIRNFLVYILHERTYIIVVNNKIHLFGNKVKPISNTTIIIAPHSQKMLLSLLRTRSRTAPFQLWFYQPDMT